MMPAEISRRGSGTRFPFSTTTLVPLSDIREPSRRALGVAAFSAHRLEVELLDLLRDRAHLAFADLPAVDFANRRDLRRRAGEERLLRDVELVARDVADLRR